MINRIYSPLSLYIVHQNIRGLNDKCEELILSLLANSIKPYMIWLTEHYTTDHNLPLLYLENYTLAANYSHINCKGGGTCIFVRNDMTLDTVSLVWKKFFEPCAIIINHGKFDLIVIYLYNLTISFWELCSGSTFSLVDVKIFL